MNHPERAAWTIERAETAAQRGRAAEILVAHLTQPLADMRRQEIENSTTPRDVFLACRGEQAIGAVAAMRMPGLLSLFWPPRIVATEADTTRQQVAAELIQATLLSQAGDGVTLAQAMLATDEDPQPFVAAGFTHLARLIYLQTSSEAFPQQPPDRLRFEPLAADGEDRFRQLLEATYENTLDCPDVHRILSVDATLASYRGQAGYDPKLWFIARHADQDVGCLILAAHSPELWELVYMGLMPTARGQGLGQDLVAQSLWLAGQQGVRQVALAVDAANTPALAAYRRFGFEPFDELDVYIRPLA